MQKFWEERYESFYADNKIAPGSEQLNFTDDKEDA